MPLNRPYSFDPTPFGERPRSAITGQEVATPEEMASAGRELLRHFVPGLVEMVEPLDEKGGTAWYGRKKGEAGIYEEPRTTKGEILVGPRGLSEGIKSVKQVRDIMREEFRKRGAAEDWFGQVLRGPFYHGRSTYPRTGGRFDLLREKIRHPGEPQGISISATPKVPVEKRFAERLTAEKLKNPDIETLYDKVKGLAKGHKNPVVFKPVVTKYRNNLADTYKEIVRLGSAAPGGSAKPVARVIPLYGTRPEDVILKAWEGSEDADKLRRAYMQSLEWTLAQGDRTKILKSGGTVQNELARALGSRAGTGRKITNLLDAAFNNKTLTKYGGKEEYLGALTHARAMTGALEKMGVEGVLYSRGRYEEDELKMLHPENVMMLDLRNPEGEEIKRATKTFTRPFRVDDMGRWLDDPESLHTAYGDRMMNWGAYGPKGHHASSLGRIYEKLEGAPTWEEAWKKNMGGSELKVSRKTKEIIRNMAKNALSPTGPKPPETPEVWQELFAPLNADWPKMIKDFKSGAPNPDLAAFAHNLYKNEQVKAGGKATFSSFDVVPSGGKTSFITHLIETSATDPIAEKTVNILIKYISQKKASLGD